MSQETSYPIESGTNILDQPIHKVKIQIKGARNIEVENQKIAKEKSDMIRLVDNNNFFLCVYTILFDLFSNLPTWNQFFILQIYIPFLVFSVLQSQSITDQIQHLIHPKCNRHL